MEIRDGKDRIPQVRELIGEYARGLGEAPVTRILERAKAAGYREMVPDTPAPMRAAISLYEKFGFRTCEAYYRNPFEDVIYMRKAL